MSSLKQPKDVPRAKDALGNDIPDARMSRRTEDGKTLTYMLNVIQQPQRARACGSGAKSSADRRPVDPPPVVELRIFEGESQKDPDVTFSYKANFFLFATLESCRPIAPGRVQPTPSQTPVLTGMPVSGMAYLDRPIEAGYFIFPDLSVRHEGDYRLSFNLYESIDPSVNGESPSPADQANPLDPNAPNASFDWRMEVKSHSFPVFSAKKFPGLSESTQLSRVVAEQGCRVRIRRDVRMRRREKNVPEDYEHINEPQQDAWARPAHPMEQPQEVYPREHSNVTPGSDDHRRMDDQRRMSTAGWNSPQYGQGPGYPPQQSPSPPLQDRRAGPDGYLGDVRLVNHQQGPAQFAAPQAPQPPPHSHQYQPPPPDQYQQQHQPHYRAPPPPPPPIQPQPQQYGQPYAPPAPSYSANQPRDVYERDQQQRRPSVPFQHQSLPPNPYPSIESSYSLARPNYPPAANGTHPSHDQPHALAPLRMHDMHSPTGPPLPPKSTSYITPDFEPPVKSTYSQYQDHPRPPPEPTTGKRPFESAFNNTPAQQPLYNGRRPAEPDYNHAEETSRNGEPPLVYKRANLIWVERDPSCSNPIPVSQERAKPYIDHEITRGRNLQC